MWVAFQKGYVIPIINCFQTYRHVKVDVLTREKLFFPVNDLYHWRLFVIDTAKKEMTCYDSLHRDGHGEIISKVLVFFFVQYAP